MPRDEMDRLFATIRGETPPGLASGFAPSVLFHAKRVKRALVLHRRTLAIASLLSLAAALLISTWVGHSVAIAPPHGDLFVDPVFAAPPSQP